MMSGLMKLNLNEDPEQKRYLAVTGYAHLEQGADTSTLQQPDMAHNLELNQFEFNQFVRRRR